MLKEEFEKLTGRKVSLEKYVKVNALYGQVLMNKQDFCKAYADDMENNPIVAELSDRMSATLIRICTLERKRDELVRLILQSEYQLSWVEVSKKVREVTGLDLWVKSKLEVNAPLTQEERRFLLDRIIV